MKHVNPNRRERNIKRSFVETNAFWYKIWKEDNILSMKYFGMKALAPRTMLLLTDRLNGGSYTETASWC